MNLKKGSGSHAWTHCLFVKCLHYINQFITSECVNIDFENIF